jgi:hypothetical protein
MAMARGWPLTGRRDELRLIETALRRSGGRAGGLLLAGAAGVGKTRLAREAAATARRRGVAVRWVIASATARRLPLGAFAPWLGGTEGDPAAVPRQARRALLADVGRAALMVAVDDVHLLDDVSALLVQQLALRDSATWVGHRSRRLRAVERLPALAPSRCPGEVEGMGRRRYLLRGCWGPPRCRLGRCPLLASRLSQRVIFADPKPGANTNPQLIAPPSGLAAQLDHTEQQASVRGLWAHPA